MFSERRSSSLARKERLEPKVVPNESEDLAVVAGFKASRLMPMDTPIVDGDPDAPVSNDADALSEERYLPGMSKSWLLPLYDPLVRLLGIESHHRRLVELATFGAGERVLEIGCGTGNLTLLIKRLHPKADIIGIDPDDMALSPSPAQGRSAPPRRAVRPWLRATIAVQRRIL